MTMLAGITSIQYTIAVAKSRVKLSDQIRGAVRESDMTRYEIWKATGIDQGAQIGRAHV